MNDSGLENSSEFLWKVYMKYNSVIRQVSQLFKDPETGEYERRYPIKDKDNCIQRARKEW